MFNDNEWEALKWNKSKMNVFSEAGLQKLMRRNEVSDILLASTAALKDLIGAQESQVSWLMNEKRIKYGKRLPILLFHAFTFQNDFFNPTDLKNDRKKVFSVHFSCLGVTTNYLTISKNFLVIKLKIYFIIERGDNTFTKYDTCVRLDLNAYVFQNWKWVFRGYLLIKSKFFP